MSERIETAFHEKESGLLEVLQPLVLRWKLLLAGVLVGILSAAAVSLLIPKEYETAVLLNVGLFIDRPLEDSHSVLEVLNSQSFRQNVAAKLPFSIPTEKMKKWVVARADLTRNSPWITILARGKTPEQSVQFANAISNGIIARHTAFYDDMYGTINDYREDLRGKYNSFNQEVEALRKNLEDYRSSGKHDPATELLMQSRLNDKENQAITYRRELREMDSWFTKSHSRKTEMVSQPFLPQKPVKPNWKLNILVGGLASFLVMVTVILGMSQFQKNRPW